MKVISKPGTMTPKEGKPREYVNDNEPQEVPETAYYLRLVADGSLLKVDEAPKAGKKGGTK